MNISNFFKCKPIEQLLAESKQSYGMERTLGSFQLTMLGIGAIVGAGIYAFIGIAVGQHAGPATIISFVIAGLGCICAAFCYAELASALPISGGSYTFTYATLGELPAFVLGGVLLLGYCLTAASVAASWSSYMQSLLLDYGIQLPAILSKHFGHIVTLTDGTQVKALIDLPALFITVVIFTLVYAGTELSAFVNTILVIIKMSVLFIIIMIGITKINVVNWHPFIPENTGKFGEFGISGIITASYVIILGYTGFDVVATAAQETKNPQRDLPIGIIGSLVICIIFYISLAAVLTGMVPYKELNVLDPIAVAAYKFHMPWLLLMVKIGAILGLASVILAIAYGCVRILFTVIHDGLLPKKLAKIHPKHHTPYIVTIIICGIIIILGAIIPVDRLVNAANFGLLASFVVVCVATIVLRNTKPELPREFKCPLVPYLPLAGIVLFGVVFCGLSKETFVLALGWIITLLLIYLGYSHKNSVCNKND